MKPDEIRILIQHRLEQAKTAIEDAQGLIDLNRSSVSIINRSYYGMFYATLALLQTIGKTPSKHAGVISLLNTEFVLKGLLPRHLGRALHEVFDLRQTSDYQVTSPPDREEALETFRTATQFVGTIEKFLQERGYLSLEA